MLGIRFVTSFAFALTAFFAFALASVAAAADKADGKFACDGQSITVKYGWLVRGPNATYNSEKDLPDIYDPKGKTMLRIYFSDTDVGSAIKACKNLSCTKDAIKNGFMIDVADPKDLPELPYRMWITEGDAKCNSMIKPSALQLSTNQPDHVAGKLHLSEMGGNDTADVDFDLRVIITVKTEFQLE